MTTFAGPRFFTSSPDGKPGTFLASVCALCIIAVIILQTLSPDNSAITLAVATILLSGFTAIWRFRRHGLDPLGLFSFAFCVYDGVLLFRLATISDSSALVYPTTFNNQTYSAAGAMCTIAAATILVSAFVCESIVKRHDPSSHSVVASSASSFGWFWTGLVVYAVGLVLYFLQFQQLGGYLASLAMDRGDRFELAGQAELLSYPYLAFVVPGIAALFYGAESGSSSGRRTVCYGLLLLWCVLVLLQGDRRLALQALLTSAAVLSMTRPAALRFKFRTWLLLVAAYIAFSVFGHTRVFITLLASGQSNVSDVATEISDSVSTDSLTPEHSEFAGPYLSLLSAISEHTQSLYGSSYYESFLTVLPRFLYPGVKPRVLAEIFAAGVHRGSGTASGWGYNPVAEAYINFGVFGIAVAFVLWTLFFLAVGALRGRGIGGTLLYAVLLSEAISANRIDFRNVYCETFYFVAVLCIAGIMASVMKKLVKHSVRISLPDNNSFSCA